MRNSDGTFDATSGRQAKLYRNPRSDVVVDRLAKEHGTDPSEILHILQGIAKAGEPINSDRLGAIADATHVDDARVAGVASFYSMLPDDSVAATPIRVCDGPACMLRGACDLKDAVAATIQGNPRWRVDRSSCLGLCDRAPAALVGEEACGSVNATRINSMLLGGHGSSPVYSEPLIGERRIAMARFGRSEIASCAGARMAGAYQALETAIPGTPEQVLQDIERSGLRGCGGAGFPTGRKWRAVADADAEKKYVICNGDESEPGAFKDRVLMEGDPHLVIEGLALAAFAVGAAEGVIYVRGEYEPSARCLERAIEEATAGGWLGRRIGGSSFSLNLRVHRGAGAYICGEETALLESLEGRRGEPRLRPPYPSTYGLLGRPTVVNNVETLCMVPAIIRHGGKWFQARGTSDRPGTKLFTASGHVRRSAAFESPLGITVRTILNRIGLGMQSGSQFKMALTGGAAGTLIPESLLDVPLDYESVGQGVSLGSGVVMFFDTSVSAVDVLEWLLRFFRHESCGKCTPCREGSRVAHELAQRIAAGDGRPGDLAELRRLATILHTTSFCGLGQSIELPITSALEHFAEDFEKCGAT
ncbi:NADH-ubiquinone oxidoreductase-F iron-sulfur binding region domain-containing protein [Pirellulales bacterium]|nr:NADH-ubiquinone oxidoreductase-F iron-sulfur binding region domain-containing protein [Pirellulales bacterium]